MKKTYEGLQPQGHTGLHNVDDLFKARMAELRRRDGKTRRDHASGAHKRRTDNQRARDEYVQQPPSPPAASLRVSFPNHAARGNGNSSKRKKYYG